MIKKSKLITLVILVALAAISLIAGCKVGLPSADEIKETNNLKAQVTYFSNGGVFDDGEDEKTLYYQPETPILDIGKTYVQSGEISITREGYELLGWHVATTKEVDGVVTPVDDNGELVYGDKMDFTKKIKEGEHLYLCAVWARLIRVNVILVGDSITVGEKTYNAGSEISYFSFGSEGLIENPSYAGPVAATNATFLEYYADESCTQLVQWPIQKPTNGADGTIYAKYVQGDWEVWRTAKDVTDSFGSLGSKSYYLLNDIDCDGAKIEQGGSRVNAKIQGNGKTISNFTLYQEGISTTTTTGLFGRLGDDAEIKNINLENITVKYTIKSSNVTSYLSIFAFCTEASQKAQISGVNLSIKLVLDVPDSASITNIYVDENADGVAESYKSDNWLFGGKTTDSNMQGVTVDSQNSGCYIVSGRDANGNDELNQII